MCQPDAVLYMRVDKTCPLYWATWEVDREVDAIEILVPKLPQKDSRENTMNGLGQYVQNILSASLLR